MKPPAFQFYPRDFAIDTAAMSAAERGGYMALLCAAWIGVEGAPQCHLVADSLRLRRLAGMTPAEWSTGAGSIIAKFSRVTVEGVEYLYSKRLLEELAKQRGVSERAKAKAAKRWPVPVPAEAPAPPADPVPVPVAEPAPRPPDPIAPAEEAFSELMAAYPRKEGEIAARHAYVIAQTAPEPLRLPPHAELMAAVREQAAAREPEYFPSLERWIRGARWRDKFPTKRAPRASPSAPSPFPNIAQGQGVDPVDPVDQAVLVLGDRALAADPGLDASQVGAAIRSELVGRREEPEVAQALAARDFGALRHLLAPLGVAS